MHNTWRFAPSLHAGVPPLFGLRDCDDLAVATGHATRRRPDPAGYSAALILTLTGIAWGAALLIFAGLALINLRRQVSSGGGGSGQTGARNATADHDEVKGAFFEGPEERHTVAKIEVARPQGRVVVGHLKYHTLISI